jgi:hypothetical protein
MKPLAVGDEMARQLRGDRDIAVIRCVRTAYDTRDMPLEISEQIVLFDGDLMMKASQ